MNMQGLSGLSFGKNHRIAGILFSEQHIHSFIGSNTDGHPDIIRLNRQLSSTAVNQHRKLDRQRSTVIHDGIHGCTNGPTGKNHIIDQDNPFIFQKKTDIRFPDDRILRNEAPIVPVQGDVEVACRQRSPLPVPRFAA